ncbi:alkaline phosphatase family protein [Pollutibacter soli]|uniref:alkaline phosphatase family protein n=1 Tax=Pollutibacter soli TaxID=3034157 RepID=UPI003013774B
MKKFFTIILATILFDNAYTQTNTSENIIVITMDGFRWQELFGGADSVLCFDTTAEYSYKYVQKQFWAPTAVERRKKLMPFFWSQIASKGMLLGNRQYGNFVNNANPYWFSYPGYNEIFTGYPDKGVNSNDKIPNPNENVFEYLNKMPEFKNKTVVFGSWDVYSSIFNEARSGLLVNDGFRDLGGKLTERQQLFNRLQHEMPDLFHGGERLDLATFNIAFEYMKVNKPKLMYIGLGDTDEWAHAGRYDYYLDAIQKSDAWIRQIWEYIQSTKEYANKTTLIITTDHGRGSADSSNWKHHGEKIYNASEIWIAAIGPSVPPSGENKTSAHYQQGQIAATIAEWLGKSFKPKHTPLPALSIGKK